jgi:hypothetical protein
MTHLPFETLLELASDPALARPAHLQACAECHSELALLEAATSADMPETLPPLRWLPQWAAPVTGRLLADFGSLVFGPTSHTGPGPGDLVQLHPRFHDFLGEEPAAQLVQRIVK